ncbi:phosphotyrosine protein phosphatase [Dyella thiooxydans]|uniref:protein-tyrosine-phosphatase n=1 Tax=Dyella thiooxydans TaxID=445710 RepID=A0A160N386_9GAMM|nr:low molecular weight phosphotyrosine protein phosphatase [Dyella thiooxydans]AND69822.1 phosphotyrosine protein phosphatase [Dyella thiooxydans]
MAEFLFRARIASCQVQVASAGLGALAGRPIEMHALTLLHEHQIDASAHRARQLDRRMLHGAELVLAMERVHLAAVARLAPETRGKLFHIGKWLEATDIPDPYLESREVFAQVYARIEQAVDSWLPYLL